MARVYEVGDPANFASSDLKIRRDFYPIVSAKCEKAEIEGKDIFWEEFSEPQCYHCQQGGRRMYYPDFYKNDTDEIIPMLTIWPGNKVKLLLSTREGSEDSVSKGKLFVEVTGKNRKEGDVILSGLDENNMITDVSIEQENIEIELEVHGDRGAFYCLKILAVNRSKDILVGQVNIQIPELDVFTKSECQPLINYFMGVPDKSHDHRCLNAVIHAQELLLGENLKSAYQLDPLTMYTYMDTCPAIQKYIKDRFVCQYENDRGGTSGDYPPVSMIDNIHTDIYFSVLGKPGYHVFGLSIYYGVHTLTLIVNTTDPCKPKFAIYDQFGDRLKGEYPLTREGFKNVLLKLTKIFWDWYYNYNKGNRKEMCSLSETVIWKIKK